MIQKFNSKNSSSFLLLLTLLFTSVIFADAQTRRTRPRARTVTRTTPAARAALNTVASGEKIRVRIDEELSSSTARVGDRFNTKVTEPVYSTNGAVVIPTGSTIVGRVDSVQANRKGGKPGSIDVSFVQVRLPNGQTRSINGTLTDLDSDDARSNNEGSASGGKTKNRKLIFIGGGGAGGAVLGGAVGGGKGALIGAIIGGIGGAITENQTKGEEVTVKSGTEFGVLLNQAVSLPKYAGGN
jgi:hypothetical protein